MIENVLNGRTASYVSEIDLDRRGRRTLWRLDEPIEWHRKRSQYVVLDYVRLPGLSETMCFLAGMQGEIMDWREIAAAHDDTSDGTLLRYFRCHVTYKA